MIRTQTTVGTRIHTRTMAEMMRIRILSSYTAGTFYTHIPNSYRAGTPCALYPAARRLVATAWSTEAVARRSFFFSGMF
jgi:hypothetical protein